MAGQPFGYTDTSTTTATSIAQQTEHDRTAHYAASQLSAHSGMYGTE